MNVHLYPKILRDEQRKQYSVSEVEHARPLCKARYTAEAYFSHVSMGCLVLKDRVKYGFLDLIDFAWDYGHGHANLRKPIRLPLFSTIHTNRVTADSFWVLGEPFEFNHHIVPEEPLD